MSAPTQQAPVPSARNFREILDSLSAAARRSLAKSEDRALVDALVASGAVHPIDIAEHVCIKHGSKNCAPCYGGQYLLEF